MGADRAASACGSERWAAAVDVPEAGGERGFLPAPDRMPVADAPARLPATQHCLRLLRGLDRRRGLVRHVRDVLYRRSRALEGRDESPTAAIIDSQSVRTGAEAREMVGFDAGKRVKGRKRHLVTDTLGQHPACVRYRSVTGDALACILLYGFVVGPLPGVLPLGEDCCLDANR